MFEIEKNFDRNRCDDKRGSVFGISETKDEWLKSSLDSNK